MAPLDGAPERSLALGEIARPTGEQRESLPEPSQQIVHSQDVQAAGRELYGQREAVEPGGDVGDGRDVFGADPKTWAPGCGTFREERHGLGSKDLVRIGYQSGIRDGEGWDEVLALARDVERDAAGGQDGEAWGRVEEPGHGDACRDDPLGVVEHQKELPVPQVVGECLHEVPTGFTSHQERLGDHGRDQGRVHDRAEVGEEHPVGEVLEAIGRHLEGQAGLPRHHRGR